METAEKNDTTTQTGKEETYANLRQTGEKIKKSGNEAMTCANDTLHSVQDYYRQNPGKSLAIAAGVGAVLTAVLIKAFGERKSPTEAFISQLLDKAEKTWGNVKSNIRPAMR